jgi:glyceraldehyde 3-phosphate dehydrogenase
VIGNPASCIFDASWTTEVGHRMVKVLGWYDNEYGYSMRTADIIEKVAAL